MLRIEKSEVMIRYRMLFMLALVTSSAVAQSIAGRVTNQAGEPLKNAVVHFGKIASSGEPPHVETDAAGEFVFDASEPDRYRLSAEHTGYLRLYPDAPISVAAGQRVTGISIQLTRAALIAGRVVNENGDPFPNIGVVLRTAELNYGPGATTGADGSFVIGGLPAGRYRIAADAGSSGIRAAGAKQEVYVRSASRYRM